jgi:SAM-dependent methyltransferase
MHVLDLGGRSGFYSFEANRRASTARFLVADISQPHLRRARCVARDLHRPVYPLACSGEALPLCDASVDAVLVIEVLQFVKHDAAMVQEVGRVLRPGGRLLCEQELDVDDGYGRRTIDPTLQKWRPGHSIRSLVELAGSANLILRRHHAVEGNVGRWWQSREAWLHSHKPRLAQVLFPLLRFLSAVTAPRGLVRRPRTILYEFVKHPAVVRQTDGGHDATRVV